MTLASLAQQNAETEISTTVLAAFGVMLTAEGTPMEVSGVLAVVFLGLSMAAYGKYHVSPPVLHELHQFWTMLGYLANTLIFFLTG
jgi:CPA1 family monovalent cation:H+ antiporter